MTFWEILKCVAVGYMLIFSVNLFFNNTKNKANFILSLFFIVETISVLNTILWRCFSYTHLHLPYLFYIDNSVFYLRGVLLLFYVNIYLNPAFSFKHIHLLHLFPSVIISAMYTINFHCFTAAQKTYLLKNGVFSKNINFTIEILLHLLIVVYITVSIIKIINYARQQTKPFKNPIKQKIYWPAFLTGTFMLIMMLDISFIIFEHLTGIFAHVIVNIINTIVFTLAISVLLLGLNKNKIICQNKTCVTTLKSVKTLKKYAKSNLKKCDSLKIKEQLEFLLNVEKIYREPSISLNDIANKIGVLPKHLSQVINQYYNRNYFELINYYRIEEAKTLLTKYNANKKNVLETLYETGFNSKTAFNHAFKKQTGYTPTTYRQLFSVNNQKKLA